MTDPIPAPTLPRTDGAVLHFLKELPAWFILGIFTAGFLVVWQISHDDFIPRIIDGLIGALLLSLQRAKAQAPLTESTESFNAENAKERT